MPRIAHVVDERLGIDYGFMYELRNGIDLEEYTQEVAQPRWACGFWDDFASRNLSHAATAEGNLIREYSALRGKSQLETLGRMVEDGYLSMTRALSAGPIVVNRNGGYFPLTHQKVKESREIHTWTLPGATLKISQWPNGTHFYARIGDEDVVLYGRRKWDTKEEAEQAAKKFARIQGIALEQEGA